MNMNSQTSSYLDQRTAMQLEAGIPTLREALERIAGVHHILQSQNEFEVSEEALRWYLSDLETAITDE